MRKLNKNKSKYSVNLVSVIARQPKAGVAIPDFSEERDSSFHSE